MRVGMLISIILVYVLVPHQVAAGFMPTPVTIEDVIDDGKYADAPDEKKDETHRIAIVIDDFGNGMKGTEEMFQLGFPFTVAVMPFLPTTEQDARKAHELGLDVLVHLPMEPNHGKPSWLGPGAITTDLTDDEIRKRVEEAIANVPHAVGVNNHMGSKATSDARVMRIVMEVCRDHGLFFLDSRTSYRSKAGEEAIAAHVPLIQNNIFLDDIYTASHVRKQIQKVLKRAEEERITVVIGHVGSPGRITAAMLKKSAEELQSVGQLVRLSELLPYRLFPTIK